MVGRLGAVERVVRRRAGPRARAGCGQAAGAGGRSRLLRQEESMMAADPRVVQVDGYPGWTSPAGGGMTGPTERGDRSRASVGRGVHLVGTVQASIARPQLSRARTEAGMPAIADP